MIEATSTAGETGGTGSEDSGPGQDPPGPSDLLVRDLRISFSGPDGVSVVVEDVSFDVPQGRVVGLVGESGSGKSAAAAAVAGVLPGAGLVEAGTASFRGKELLSLRPAARRRLQGREIAFLFQEPGAALNPVLTLGEHFDETVRAHRRCSRRDARALGREWLERVRMPAPGERLRAYPHELSGGMQQRAALALALCLEPALLIADEPTTALDVTVQAAILRLFREVVAEPRRSVLLITHDLGVIAEVADEVLVMVSGRIVERADVVDLFERPRHPYTRALLAARPPPLGELNPQPSRVPLLPPVTNVPEDGCTFRPRCPHAVDACAAERPELAPRGRPSQPVACLRAEELPPW